MNKYELPEENYDQYEYIFEHERDVPKFTYDSSFMKELKENVSFYFRNRSTKAPMSRWLLILHIYI